MSDGPSACPPGNAPAGRRQHLGEHLLGRHPAVHQPDAAPLAVLPYGEATAQRSKAQPAQTVRQPGSMESFEAQKKKG